MDQGRIQQDAAPEQTYRTPANRFVAGFIGVTNFLPATVTDAGAPEVRVGETTLQGRAGTPLDRGEAVEVALRAERLRVRPARADVEGVEARVEEVIFEGDRLVYGLTVHAFGDARLVAFDTDPLGHGRHAVGDDVRLAWQPDDVMIFPTTS
jgi:putative spermidine/putrescine transport system ATP-binding protein